VNRRWLTASTAVVLAACAGCGRDAADTAATRERDILQVRAARLDASLSAGDSRTEPIARWLLPAELAEISGLALTPDGRLFTHNDETARISEIDYRSGTIKKHFFAGEKSMHADFEGLTYANNRFVLLSSNGVLYEFPEGTAGERVDVTVHDTGLGKECEFEGVVYDSLMNAYVLACKNVGETEEAIGSIATVGNGGDAEISEYRRASGREKRLETDAPHGHHRRSVGRRLRARFAGKHSSRRPRRQSGQSEPLGGRPRRPKAWPLRVTIL
jgi:hypothetical protein